MVQCVSCGRAQEARLICLECGGPLAANPDYFAAFGIPRKLQIDTAKLEALYHDLGRRLHPDRFVASPARVRDASMRATALLTRAYRTLRDPVNRGLYWLELNGRRLADKNQQVPMDLAETVFAVQEQLAELREAHEANAKAAEGLRSNVVSQREELRHAMDELEGELTTNFAHWDAGDRGDSNGLFEELKATLSKIAYLRTLLRDVDRELDTVKAA